MPIVTFTRLQLAIAIVFAFAIFACPLHADEPTPRLSYQSVFLREPVDQPWSITLTGAVPSLPGCFLIVHDVNGKQLVRRVVPHGELSAGNPVRLDFPADGVTGDYQMILVGFEDDRLALALPLSDLPYEVYGRHHFATKATSRFFFRAPPETNAIDVFSYGGSLRILEDGKEVVDTKRDGKLERYDWHADVPLRADAVYRLEPYACRYFGSRDGLFLAVDPDRWFLPDSKLEAIKWWQFPAP